ncbi:MAG TPA: thioredoxin domain-containing protein, partial [Gaiellaceae bacterium]|nr:thioredoxin domain-containing protein [Gaiellaceae bacterium]
MNRLAGETSPYLLQHAGNPVDWYPWGDEALARARDEDKPILLSIGYAACHWCHVMEHESFENAAIAAEMNEHFISVKVDREERPDLDAVYMEAVVALSGQGGWPMTVFLTPGGEPFYGGTYYPPEPRHGLPSFPQVLDAVAAAWRDRRDEVETSAAQLVDAVGRSATLRPSHEPLIDPVLTEAVRGLRASFEPAFGGWG